MNLLKLLLFSKINGLKKGIKMQTHLEIGKTVYKNLRDSIRESMRKPKIQPVKPYIEPELDCKEPIFNRCKDINDFLRSEIQFIEIEVN